MKKKFFFLITGSAGFIGYHLTNFLLQKKNNVIGIDNFKGFYDNKIKLERIKILKKFKNFKFYKNDIANVDTFLSQTEKKNIKVVFHLAAQPGVRLSEKYSDDYLSRNLISYLRILHFTSRNKIPYFFYASSSSVYGNTKDQKESFYGESKSYYGLTKLINEKIAFDYSNYFTKTKYIGLRFFTVYGPLGRPDMAIYKMTKDILNNEEITLFNKGLNSRDFTYIDDLIFLIFNLYKKRNLIKTNHIIFNTGLGTSYTTLDMLKIIEKYLNKKAKITFGNNSLDVIKTQSNFSKLKGFLKLKKITKTSLDQGIKSFIEWYKIYHKVN